MNTHRVAVDATHDTDGNYAILACPLCGENNVHMDDVHVGGRPQEDGDFVNVTVSHTGKVAQHVYPGEMATPDIPHMRRHYITITGWCEQCGERFAYAFVQHKGQTKLQLVQSRWTAVDGR